MDDASRPFVFLTLGPPGTNHELVTQNYMASSDLAGASIELIDDFRDGLAMIAGDEANFMIQAAAHPDTAEIIATAHFKFRIRAVDTFIAPSKELAILTRRDVETPRSIALHPATESYADLSAWEELIPVQSIVAAGEGLLAGEYDSGLTALELAKQHPDVLRVDARLGSVDDPWIVYGKRSPKGTH